MGGLGSFFPWNLAKGPVFAKGNHDGLFPRTSRLWHVVAPWMGQTTSRSHTGPVEAGPLPPLASPRPSHTATSPGPQAL